MTADARFLYEVAMGVNRASAEAAVSEAGRAAQRIVEQTNRALSQGFNGPNLNPINFDTAEATRRAREYGARVQEALRQELGRGGSGALDDPTTALVNKLTSGQQGQPINKLFDAQLDLARARLNQAVVRFKNTLPRGSGPASTKLPPEYGNVVTTERGYTSDRHATDATIEAEKRLNRALGTVAKEEEAFERNLVAGAQRQIRARDAATDAIFASVFGEQRANRRRDVQFAALEKARQGQVDATIADVRATQASSRKLTRFFDDLAASRQKAQEQLGASMALDITRGTKATGTAAANDVLANAVPFPGAENDLTPRGKLQNAVNTATLNNIKALDNETRLLNKQSYTIAEAAVAETARINSTRTLAEAERKLAAYNTGAGGPAAPATEEGGGFFGNFGTGFNGRSSRPYSEQIGQAFKFSVFYGTAYRALSAITQSFQTSVQEGIQFQQAVTELRIATKMSASSATDLANEVGKEASQYGFSPSEGALIAARAQGIYGTTQANTPDEVELQRQVARTSTRVVSQLAFASGKQPADIQANLGAVAQAYDLGPQSQQYLGDLDAYFSRRFGAAPGSTIDATSQAATVGRAAGFSPAQVSAIAADIMARTGATADSTGGYLAQIFSRGGEGSLTSLLGRYSIDTNSTLAQQIEQLAAVYKNQPDQRDDISSAFGRGKVQNAVIALLQDYGEVQDSVKGQDKATGALDKATEMRLDNVGGQLQALVGSLKQLGVEVGQSGLLDFIGGAALGLKSLVDATDSVLELFNELPRGVRDAILALAAFTVANRVAAASNGGVGLVGLLGSRGAGISRFIGPAAAEGAAVGAGTRVVSTASGAVVPIASRAGAGALARNALFSPAGVVGAGLIDAFLIEKTRDSTERFNNARDAYSDYLNSDITGATSAEELRSRASQAQEVSDQSGKAASGVFARIKNLGADRSQALADQTEADRQVLEAQRAARYLDSRSVNLDSPQITGFDSESITSSLTSITDAGGNAKTQFRALANAVTDSGRAAKIAADNFDPKAVGAANYQGLQTALAKGGFGIDVTSQPNKLGDLVNASTTGAQLLGLDQPFKDKNLSAGILSKSLAGIDFNKRLTGALGNNGLSSLADLSDPDKLNSVISDVVGNLPGDIINNSDGKLGFGDYAQIQNTLSETVRKYIESLRDQGVATGKVVALTQSQLIDLTNATLATGQDVLAAIPDADVGGKVRQAEANLRAIQRQIQSTASSPTVQVLDNLQKAMNDAAQARYNQLDAQSKTLQARNGPANTAGGIAADAAIARSFARRQINSAVKNRSVDVLATIISTSDETALGYARQAIESARRAALLQAEYDAKSRALAAQLSGAADFTKQGIGDGLDKNIRRAINKQFNAMAGVLDTTASAEDPTDVSNTDTAGQIRAAQAAAEAARVGGGIAEARSAITSAQATLDEAKKGSVAYYNALASLYQARQQLTEALVAYHQNQFLLGHDATNPLVQDRAATQAAAAQLRADRARGAGADVLAQDRVNLQSAQASQESTAFSQRLEAVQTADDLGRISHSKYLSYLQHEHDRLEGIKNRTFQQQQQLNQIDQLMKQAADEMSGQFNFGDIKLPSPYEVRRKIAEEAAAVKNPAGQRSPDPTLGGIGGPLLANVPSTTYITIDGADTAKVKAILTDVLGKRATTTTTSPRHR